MCFGFLKTKRIPKRLKCIDCGGNGNVPKGVDVVKFCRLRLLLAFCHLTGELPDKLMNDIPLEARNELWNYLEKASVVEYKNGQAKLNEIAIKECESVKQMFLSEDGINSMEIHDWESEFNLSIKRFKSS